MVSPRNENRAIASLFAGRGSRSSHLSYIFTTDADVWAKKGAAMAEAVKRGSGRGADQGLGRVDGDAARFLDEVEAGAGLLLRERWRAGILHLRRTPHRPALESDGGVCPYPAPGLRCSFKKPSTLGHESALANSFASRFPPKSKRLVQDLAGS